MNVIKEIEKGIKRCQEILTYDLENAKKYKVQYREEVGVLISANEKFIDEKSKELEAWCEASENVWSLPQEGIFLRIKRKVLMAVTNHYISNISGEMARAGIAREKLDEIKSRFDGFIYLT